MTIQESYYFEKADYNENGFSKKKESFLFLYFIRELEKQFIEKHSKIMPANHLFANYTTIRLIDKCLITDDNEYCGMEHYGTDDDVEVSMKMEEYSKNKTIYAIGSFLDEDEPLFLVIDNSIKDNRIVLKHISDSDEGVENETTPIETGKTIVRE